jgi:hypothetical protein
MPRIPVSEWQRNVPTLMRLTPNWVGSFSKRPVQCTTQRPAKVDDPRTWEPFERALDFLWTHEGDNAWQAGFAFTREARIAFLDFDHCIGPDGTWESWARPLIEPLVGRHYLERSPSGRGVHCFALDPDNLIQVAPGRTGCRQSIGNGALECYVERRYSTVTGDVGAVNPLNREPPGLALVDDAILECLRLGGLLDRLRGLRKPGSVEEVDEDEIRAAIDWVDPDCDYGTWIEVGMAVRAALGDSGFSLFDEWSARGAKYKSGETSEKWASFTGGGVGAGTLFHHAREAGWSGGLNPEQVFKPITDEDLAKLDSAGEYEWSSGLAWKAIGAHTYVSGSGKGATVKASEGDANVSLYLRRHPSMSGLRLNVRSQQLDLGGEPLSPIDLQCRLTFFFDWRRAPSATAVVNVARQLAKPYDPVEEWLRSLEWDGAQRIADFPQLVGLEHSDVAKRMVRRWMIGAVARACRPGCKMQNMLVLCGRQGPRKSTFFERLARRKEWHFEGEIAMDSKDGQMKLLGPWIVENAELSSMRRADVDKVKTFISESVSSFRPPYGGSVESFPRRCVLGGTVNGRAFLRDDTGSRRFWVVGVEGELRLSLMTDEYVDQLWAEALALYDAGERWWDEADEVQEVNERNEEHYDTSALDGWIANLLEELGTTKAVTMQEVLRLLSRDHGIPASTPLKNVGSGMRLAGWKARDWKIDGATKKVWAVPGTMGDSRSAAEIAWKRGASGFKPVDST